MKTKKQLSILITGAGSGMGLHTAQTLAIQGHKVYAGIRDFRGRNSHKATALKQFVESKSKKIEMVDLDIHYEESCNEAIKKIIEKEGTMDVVIHNAAHLFIGYSEAFTPEQIASSVNTNVLGAHRLNRAVLPFMRKQQKGLILYVGSGITNVTGPFMTPYVIGKAGLDALAENTAYEISQFGIETTILMPGVFMEGTSHFETAEFPKDAQVIDDYSKLDNDYNNYDQGLRNLFRFGVAPIQGVADRIAEIIEIPEGQRPFRDTVDYSDWLAEPGNSVREKLTERVFKIMGYSHLLKVKK